jgi:sensor histidine kinase YesM
MTRPRNKVLLTARDLFIFLGASVIQTYFTCPGCTTFSKYAQVSLFSFLIWFVLWKGNDLLAHYISKRISWIEFPLKRMLVGIVSTITFTILAVLLLIEFFKLVFELNFGSGYIYTIYFSVGITILISLVLHSRSFYLHWRAAVQDAERYEKESISARYENLKSQINPHFLFNTLNVLTNLVYEDQDKAVKFIKQLSEVYRHVLDTRDKELITLEEERKFLDSYLFLQQMRFGDKLKLNIQLNGLNSLMPPLVLQMLIENAIKHNEISEERPLTISVRQENNFIIVENNFQKRTVLAEESPGMGLENISKRYKFLTDEPVEILQGDKFIVKLPIIPVDL